MIVREASWEPVLVIFSAD